MIQKMKNSLQEVPWIVEMLEHRIVKRGWAPWEPWVPTYVIDQDLLEIPVVPKKKAQVEAVWPLELVR